MIATLRLRLLAAYRVRGKVLYEFRRQCDTSREFLTVLDKQDISLDDAETCIRLYLEWDDIMRAIRRSEAVPASPMAAVALLHRRRMLDGHHAAR